MRRANTTPITDTARIATPGAQRIGSMTGIPGMVLGLNKSLRGPAAKEPTMIALIFLLYTLFVVFVVMNVIIGMVVYGGWARPTSSRARIRDRRS